MALRASHPDYFPTPLSSSSSSSSSSSNSSAASSCSDTDDPIPHPTIPTHEITRLLSTYQARRHARTASVVAGAHFHCATQLKVTDPSNPLTQHFMQRLPHLTNELWLHMTLDGLCRAHAIDGWPEARNGPRVNRYAESARRFLEGAERRKAQMGVAARAGAGERRAEGVVVAAVEGAGSGGGSGVGGAAAVAVDVMQQQQKAEKQAEMVPTAA
ncbi:hypothetical protein SLS55_000301 [Diplodia seriata]|uniref:Uncharacterized protein n=1 Tax=Diplodia seriata TaxID=420778 RepID=A0ABR3CTW9_9PEZI